MIQVFSSGGLAIERLAVTDHAWWAPDPQAATALARLAFSPRLKELNLAGLVGHSVYTAIIHLAGNATILSSLSSLALPGPANHQLPTWFKFLDLCPNLVHLMVWSDEGDDLTHSKPPGLLSRLESFCGPLIHALLLVPGSPVHEVTFDGLADSFPVEQLALLARSTDVLRRIRLHNVPWASDDASALARLFPQVEDIQVKITPLVPLVSTHKCMTRST